MYRPYVEYMTFDDIVNKYSFYSSIETYTGVGYMFANPIVDKMYVPYLLHTNIVDGLPNTNTGAAVIDGVLQHNMEHPPFILVTEGKFGLKNFIRDGVFNQYVSAVNVILSCNGNMMFKYEHPDNTPQELLDLIAPWWSRGKTNHSREAETLSCAYDIPCLTLHCDFVIDDIYDSIVHTVQNIMNECSTDFSSYTYSVALPHASTNNGTGMAPRVMVHKCCDLCGRRRPTTYFYRTHANLCNKCVNRIKTLGVVNYTNMAYAKVQIERQRFMTRLANASKTIKVCPICGHPAIVWNTGQGDCVGVCANCNRDVYHRNYKQFFFVDTCLGMVYEYSSRKLLSISGLSDHKYVRICDNCGCITTQFVEQYVGDVPFTTCSDCERIDAERQY